MRWPKKSKLEYEVFKDLNTQVVFTRKSFFQVDNNSYLDLSDWKFSVENDPGDCLIASCKLSNNEVSIKNMMSFLNNMIRLGASWCIPGYNTYKVW